MTTQQFNSLEFKIAYELVMQEFCDLNKNKTAQQVQDYVLSNPEIIADRIKVILAA